MAGHGKLKKMKKEDFKIGDYFYTGAGRWLVTDVGVRTVAAVKLSPSQDRPAGPPYDAAEVVFDEYDFAGCDRDDRFFKHLESEQNLDGGDPLKKESPAKEKEAKKGRRGSKKSKMPQDQESKFRMALDLEMNQPSGRIIQIGAVIGDVSTGEILERISLFVNLDPPEKLSQFITTLTGITKERLASEGMSLWSAYEKLADAHKRWSCQATPIIWGAGEKGNDMTILKNQLRESKRAPLEENWFVLKGWRDLKGCLQDYFLANGIPPRSGLAKSLRKIGLNFEGRAHDALDDAFNTFRVAHFLNQRLVDPAAKPGLGRPRPPAEARKKKPVRKSAAEMAGDLTRLLLAAAKEKEIKLEATQDGDEIVVRAEGSHEKRLSLQEAGFMLSGLKR